MGFNSMSSPSASELKRRFKKLALEHHPDKAAVRREDPERSTARFQLIHEAYELLKSSADDDGDDDDDDSDEGGHGDVPDMGRSGAYTFSGTARTCYQGHAEMPTPRRDPRQDPWRDSRARQEEDDDEDHDPYAYAGGRMPAWRRQRSSSRGARSASRGRPDSREVRAQEREARARAFAAQENEARWRAAEAQRAWRNSVEANGRNKVPLPSFGVPPGRTGTGYTQDKVPLPMFRVY